jgi:hypothetical protein
MKSAQHREINRKQECKTSSLLTTFIVMQRCFIMTLSAESHKSFVCLITFMFKAMLADSAHHSSRSYKNNILKIGCISIFSCTQYCCVTEACGGSVYTPLRHFSTSPPISFHVLRELVTGDWKSPGTRGKLPEWLHLRKIAVKFLRVAVDKSDHELRMALSSHV